MFRRPLTIFLSHAMLIVCAAASARATTFIVPDTADLLAVSNRVVVGRVAAIQSFAEHGVLRTHIAVSIERAVKGPAEPGIDLVEPGGMVGEQQRWIHGAPTFFVGERVLLFLHRNARQELETTFLAIGKFSIVRSSRGMEFAVRNLGDAAVLQPRARRLEQRSAVTTYELEAFLDSLREMAGPNVADGAQVQAVLGYTPSRWQAHFTFSGPPLTRWAFASKDAPIAYRISGAGDSTLGDDASTEATDAALETWSNVGCADLKLVDTGRTAPAPFGQCDGQTTIGFNDPFDELPDPVNCAGVLGVGGVCANTSTPASFNGAAFYPIDEGDVVVNNGFGDCPFWNPRNLAELLTHEVGHTLGLAHSSELPSETDPSLRDATMYYAAHFDGRGATLMTDDVAAICALYPAGRMGSVTLRRFAVVPDSPARTQGDRLVVDGLLNLDNSQFNRESDTLILDIRAAGVPVFRLAVVPGDWAASSSGVRLRYRRGGPNGATTLTISALTPSALRFSLRARGLDLSATAAADPVVMSMAFGDASVSETISPLRTEAGIRIYP